MRRWALPLAVAALFTLAGGSAAVAARTGTSSGSTTARYDAGWRLLATEPFSGPALASRWGVYDGHKANPTESRSAKLFSLGNGAAHLRTVNQLGSGICWCRDKPRSRYGAWEVRARMTRGADHGPAILLWPANNKWPVGGEIDLSEQEQARRTSSAFTIHYGRRNLQRQTITAGDFTKWHVFAVEWEPHVIKFWIDGRLIYTTRAQRLIPHDPMFLALQAEPTVARAKHVSAQLEVDWVKVFRP